MTFKSHGVICAALMLAACGAAQPRKNPGGPALAPGAGQPPSAAAIYRIDPSQSEVRLLVYRAGPMARLGHNHVIVNRAVSGWVSSPASVSGGAFSLRIPVDDFIVDDADARAAEGSDFAAVVGDSARSGTRHNMLGPALLDADRYPTVSLSSVAIVQTQAGLSATVAVEIAGHDSQLTIPFVLEMSADGVAASGTAVLRQSELGLTPISVMLGALQVQDELTVKFKIVASKS
jgi:hypothetical protein